MTTFDFPTCGTFYKDCYHCDKGFEYDINHHNGNREDYRKCSKCKGDYGNKNKEIRAFTLEERIDRIEKYLESL